MEFNEWRQLAMALMIPGLPTECLYLGIGGEAGEVMELRKKSMRPGKFAKPLDKNELTLELGDVMWYVAAIAEREGIAMGDICQANIDKLSGRRQAKLVQQDSKLLDGGHTGEYRETT